MEIFKLIHLMFQLYDASIHTREFLQEASSATEHQDSDAARSYRQTYRGIIRIVIVTLIMGCIVVPLILPWAAYLWQSFGWEDVACRIVIGLIIAVPGLFVYAFAAVSLGCLLAPSSFLLGPAGKRWMQLIGTTSLSTARVVCVIWIVFGFGVMIGAAILMVRMKLPK